jgi:hypothetical protein
MSFLRLQGPLAALCLASASALSAGESVSASEAWCLKLAARLPSYPRAQCANLFGLEDTGARSVRNVPIFAREQPPLPEPAEPAVRVLFIGGIHGDELTAAEAGMAWLQRLSTVDAQRFHWNFIPVLNPDGLLARKATRVNANGVDLNRNFPTPDWLALAPRYWERMTNKDPRRFPGKAPLSEPESRWLHQEIERFRPDVMVAVHAPMGLLDFDGPQPAAPDRFGRLYLEPMGVYPGSLGNYSGVTRGIPVVTIELPHALKMPSKDDQDRIWNDMLTWLSRQTQRLARGPQPLAPVAAGIADK